MKKWFLVTAVLTSLVFFSSCSDDGDDSADDSSGVPATTTGAGTMGCKVDGNKWVAGYSVPTPGVPSAYGVSSGSYIVVWGFKVNINTTTLENTTETIGLYVSATEPGTYNLTFGTGINYGVYGLTQTSGTGTVTKNLVYVTNATNATGTLTITKYDKTSKIVSGSFSFKGEYTDPKTTEKTYVNITDGVFDIKYN